MDNMDNRHQHLSGFAKGKKAQPGPKRIINATKYSIEGIKAAFVHEVAFRQLTSLHTMLAIILIFCPFETSIKMILLFASVLSLISELFNTSIEAAVDHTSTDENPLAKIAKDTGSAGQAVAFALMIVLWVIAIVDVL